MFPARNIGQETQDNFSMKIIEPINTLHIEIIVLHSKGNKNEHLQY